MTDLTIDPAGPGRPPKSVWLQLPPEFTVLLDLLACGTVLVMLLVGAFAFFDLFAGSAAYD